MIRTQIYLSEKEKKVLNILSKQMGKSQSELIREAIDHFCAIHHPKHRMALMQQAKGLWRDRKDLPDLTQLRKEWDRWQDENKD